jgi:hypothetical protein
MDIPEDAFMYIYSNIELTGKRSGHTWLGANLYRRCNPPAYKPSTDQWLKIILMPDTTSLSNVNPSPV